MQEKKDKGLPDFSGSKSDDLEERLQVVCLPKLSRGVVYDVQEVYMHDPGSTTLGGEGEGGDAVKCGLRKRLVSSQRCRGRAVSPDLCGMEGHLGGGAVRNGSRGSINAEKRGLFHLTVTLPLPTRGSRNPMLLTEYEVTVNHVAGPSISCERGRQACALFSFFASLAFFAGALFFPSLPLCTRPGRLGSFLLSCRLVLGLLNRHAVN